MNPIKRYAKDKCQHCKYALGLKTNIVCNKYRNTLEVPADEHWNARAYAD